MDRIQKHTLVMHLSPDLEVLFMGWLIIAYECVREALGVVDHPKLKFIPAGPLRKEDWAGEETVTAEVLEAKGYLFLDCGRGKLDQHGRPENENRNSVSSVDLMVHEANLDALLPHLMPIVAIISENDLTGEDVIPKGISWKGTATPNTPRSLRNVIQGWNVLNKDNPSRVFSLSSTAFGSIESAVGQRLAQVGDCSQTSVGNPDTSINYREFFLADRITVAAPAHFATIVGVDAHDEIANASETFRKECDDALMAMQKDWDVAVRDYWAAGTGVRDIRVATKNPDGKTFWKSMSLAFGKSEAARFGAVTRLGNDGYKRPFQGRQRRPKADVIVQFYGPGRFLIYRRGDDVSLDRVAAAVREADLRKRGVNVTKEDRQMLDRPGHIRFADQAGRPREALFFAEYRGSVGNAFRANPNSEPSPLTIDEVVDITIKALARTE